MKTLTHTRNCGGALVRLDDADKPTFVAREGGRKDVLRWTVIVMRAGVGHRVTVEAGIDGIMGLAAQAVSNKAKHARIAMLTAKAR